MFGQLGVDLTGATVVDAVARRARFEYARMSGCVFKGQKTTLQECFFDSADLEEAQFLNVTVRGSRFVGADLHGSLFRQVVLREVTLPLHLRGRGDYRRLED